MPTTRTASSSQPAKLATSGAVSRRPRASIFSMSVALNGVPLRTMTSPWRIVSRTGTTASAALSLAVSQSGWLNEELGTISGEMSSAASIRSASSSPPAIRPARRPRVSATAESRSSVRRVASRIRADSVRTAAQRAASRPARVALAVSLRSGTAVWSRILRPAGVSSAEKVVSTRETRSSNASC